MEEGKPETKFISYAQNFEDVTLWRTLKIFGPGFYIDVGANDPSRDSVTRSLYERGWRGINIEPVDVFFTALCRERSEDVNLCLAVGSDEAAHPFFESSGTGLSTLSHHSASWQAGRGTAFFERTVRTTTLSRVCAEHLRTDIAFHFLKIDVEGFEEAVLRGMDFQRWRPWIILIESSYFSEPSWHPLLVDAGYQLALRDGINRYYIANERPELLVPLSVPPNLLDNFRLCEGHFFGHPPHDDHTLHQALAEASRAAAQAQEKLRAIERRRSWQMLNALETLAQRLTACFRVRR